MQDDDQNQIKPGVAYTPQPAQPHVPEQPAPMAAQQPLQAPEVPAQPQTPLQHPAAPQPPQDELDEDFDDGNEDDAADDGDEATLLSWNAPEFTFTNKPAGWFALLALFFGAMIVVAIFTKQWISIGLFFVMAIALATYANRKPRTLNYSISTHGVYVGDKAYPFDNFSAFYEVSDYGQAVLELVPAKRLGTLVSLPVQPEHDDELEQLIGSVLPKVPARNDLVDRLVRTLRF